MVLRHHVLDSDATVRPVRFHSPKNSHEGSSLVFSGKYALQASYSGLDVICELIRQEVPRLAHEAYRTKLAELQDSTVPRFCGYYFCSSLYSTARKFTVACMLLKPCGSPAVELLSETCRPRLRYVGQHRPRLRYMDAWYVCHRTTR